MLNIEISNKASEDISDIANYTFQKYGQQQVFNYIDEIYKRLVLLSEYPDQGHIRHDIPPQFKAFPVKKHVIIYEVKNNKLYIARILHSSMAFEKHKII